MIYWFILLQLDVSTMMSIIKQIFSLLQPKSYISLIAQECWIIKRTVFNVYVCLNHSWRYEHNQFERHDEKPRHKRQFFQNLDSFYI